MLYKSIAFSKLVAKASFCTLPLFLVIFSLIGFAAGIKTMLGTAKQLAAKNKADYPAAKAEAVDPADDEEKD